VSLLSQLPAPPKELQVSTSLDIHHSDLRQAITALRSFGTPFIHIVFSSIKALVLCSQHHSLFHACRAGNLDPLLPLKAKNQAQRDPTTIPCKYRGSAVRTGRRYFQTTTTESSSKKTRLTSIMLSKTLLALAAASLVQNVIALGPRQHGHQHIHEKRAIVTEVVTETSYVYVTLYEDKTTSAAFSAKKYYTRKRPSKSAQSSVAAASAAPAASVSLESIPRPSAPVAVPVPDVPAPAPAPVPTAETPAVEPAPPAADPVPVSPPSNAPSGARGRGLAYNDPGVLGRFLGSGSRISWTYNWGQTDDSKVGVEFVPMCWGTSKGFPATWAANAQKMINAGAKALFSFNEPDHAAQANLSPEQAAASHIELMNPFQGKALIGAPSITNSGASNQGIAWLQRWWDACGGKCAVDFVNIHIYGYDTNAFLQHLIKVHNQFQKPVWITEFAFGGSDDEINKQLAVIIDQIENNSTYSFVHRYSYFMAADGIMAKGNSMSTYGNTFAYAS